MKIVLNGEESELAEGSHVTDLIRKLGLQADRVAVELNHHILRRANWATTLVAEGDRIEIVHFVGGGSATNSSLRFVEY